MFKTIKINSRSGRKLRRGGMSTHSSRRKDKNFNANYSSVQSSSTSQSGIRGSQARSITNLAQNIARERPIYNLGGGYNRSGTGRAYWRYYAQNRSASLGSRKSSAFSIRRTASRKFDSIEDLSGITRQRPEIILVSEFHPLFQKEKVVEYDNYWSAYWWARSYSKSQLTDHGKFADAKFNVDSINRAAIIRIWKRLYKARQGNKNLQKKIQLQRRNFIKKIKGMRNTANFMLQLLRVLDNSKQLFDLRDVRHNASYDSTTHQEYSVGQVVVPNDKSQYTRSELLDFTEKNLPTYNSIASTLEQYGFKRSAIESKFTSTKIWCQSINEFRHLLEHHSLTLLDRVSFVNAADQHPTAMSVPWDYTKLNIYDQIGTLNVPSLAGLADALPVDLTAIINNVSTVYWRLGWSYGINSSSRIATWIWLFSKEFRFSNGISKPEVAKALLNGFRYNVSSLSNDNVFESIFGLRTTAIDQVPETIGPDLYSLAYERPDSATAIMNFESKFIEGTSGILSPGSEYYIDDILDNFGDTSRPTNPTNPETQLSDYRFNTSRLKTFIRRLDNARTNLDIVCNGMNFLATWRADDKQSQHWERGIAHPPTFYFWLTDAFVDLKKHQMDEKYSSDVMTALLHLAASDRQLKSALFTLLALRVRKQIKRTPGNLGDYTIFKDLVDRIIWLVSRNIRRAKVYKNPKSGFYSTIGNNISETNLRFVLSTSSSPTWKKLIEIFKQLYGAMTDRNQVLSGDRTRFSGVLDTVMLMLAFDSVISIFEKYSTLRINLSYRNIAYMYSRNRPRSSEIYYLLEKRVVNSNSAKTEFNKILSRLFAERSRTIRGYISILSTIDVIRGNMQALVNYLESKQTISSVRSLINMTPGFEDPRFLRLLFNEQQMMLIISSIYDTVANMQRFYLSPDMDGDGDSDQNDLFDALDENIVTPHLRRMFMTTFGDQQFANKKGNNKQILTIGLPLGFVEKFNQQIDTDESTAKPFNAKQNDIVKIKVYKTDVRYPEVIFKPQEFLFEMSRFPVRVGSMHLKLKPTATFDDVVNAIATRDLLQDSHTNGDTIYYGNTTDFDINTDGFKPNTQIKQALSGEDYDFLSPEEKNDILTNHALSYMLELYIKVMTDLNVHDYRFYLRPEDIQRRIRDDLVQDIVKSSLTDIIGTKQGAQVHARALAPGNINLRRGIRNGKISTNGRLFGLNNWSSEISRSGLASTGRSENIAQDKVTRRNSASQTRLIRPEDIPDLMGRMKSHDVPAVLAELRFINQLANMYSPLSDPDAAARTYFSPRRYDRVFNIAVDPDDFEINVDKTLSTPFGKTIMEELLRDGEVEDLRFNKRFNRSSHRKLLQRLRSRLVQRGSWQPIYQQRLRDKGEGDIIFEKYFVTVETYGEADV